MACPVLSAACVQSTIVSFLRCRRRGPRVVVFRSSSWITPLRAQNTGRRCSTASRRAGSLSPSAPQTLSSSQGRVTAFMWDAAASFGQPLVAAAQTLATRPTDLHFSPRSSGGATSCCGSQRAEGHRSPNCSGLLRIPVVSRGSRLGGIGGDLAGLGQPDRGAADWSGAPVEHVRHQGPDEVSVWARRGRHEGRLEGIQRGSGDALSVRRRERDASVII
jgi:hypothetical protein